MPMLHNCLIDRDLPARHRTLSGGGNLAGRVLGDFAMTWSGLKRFKVTAAATTLVVTLLLGNPAAAQDGYRIVVNPSNPVSSLSKSQVSRLFLEKSTWDDGAQALPVDLLATSPIREGFSKEVLGLPVPAALDRLREVAKASGATPPPSMASDRDVLAYVRLKPGAIGYVSLSADVSGVKVVSVGGKTEHVLAGASTPAGPIPVGGRIPMPARLIHERPVYPPIARQGRVQGTVEVSVVLSPDGTVERAQIVKSIPALDTAAIDAVKKWKYAPTVVNGTPVQVTMIVQVKFEL